MKEEIEKEEEEDLADVASNQREGCFIVFNHTRSAIWDSYFSKIEDAVKTAKLREEQFDEEFDVMQIIVADVKGSKEH